MLRKPFVPGHTPIGPWFRPAQKDSHRVHSPASPKIKVSGCVRVYFHRVPRGSRSTLMRLTLPTSSKDFLKLFLAPWVWGTLLSEWGFCLGPTIFLLWAPVSSAKADVSGDQPARRRSGSHHQMTSTARQRYCAGPLLRSHLHEFIDSQCSWLHPAEVMCAQ
jgi:hypothetical protein